MTAQQSAAESPYDLAPVAPDKLLFIEPALDELHFVHDTNAMVGFVVNLDCRSHASGMTSSLKQAIGARVQAARKRSGLSQEALAAHIRRTPESISNIERGLQLPNVETLSELARALGVPLTEFFEGLGAQEGSVSQDHLRLEAELREMTRAMSPKLLRIAVEQVRVLSRLVS